MSGQDRGGSVAGEHVAGGGNLRRASNDGDFVGEVGRILFVDDSLDRSAHSLAHGEPGAPRRPVEADQVISGASDHHSELVDTPDHVSGVGHQRQRLTEILISENQVGANVAGDDGRRIEGQAEPRRVGRQQIQDHGRTGRPVFCGIPLFDVDIQQRGVARASDDAAADPVVIGEDDFAIQDGAAEQERRGNCRVEGAMPGQAQH